VGLGDEVWAGLGAGEVEGVGDGGVDDADFGVVVAKQGDVDGEFSVLLDEFAGAVEGVDEPEALPLLAFFVGGDAGFFADDGELGLVEDASDDVACFFVGKGDGGVVVFEFDLEVAGSVDLEDCFSCLEGSLQGELEVGFGCWYGHDPIVCMPVTAM